jgi:membrane protease YdiL (CAAX protease family)
MRWRARARELHPRVFFLGTWRALDNEARARGLDSTRRYDLRPMLALCVGAVMLTFMEYFGNAPGLWKLLQALQLPLTAQEVQALLHRNPSSTWLSTWHTYHDLVPHVWWALWRVMGYFVVPALLVRWGFRESIREYGLQTRGFAQHAWIYGLCFAIVLPLVIAVSFTPEFRDYYPFYKLTTRSWADFVVWEMLYAAQFFSLEFFFRGFWLRACSATMGSHAIFAMVVPYCMIHFGKPWLECLGAIIAGIVLGTLAMKTRSIWSGFLIHVSVALSMDTAAMLQSASLPSRLFP